MHNNFYIVVEESPERMLLKPKGNLDGVSAWELASLIGEHRDSKSEVVVETDYLGEMTPFGCETFRCRLRLDRFPLNQLSFRGSKGFEIAPSGCRVISGSEKHLCRCDGNCFGCKCSNKDLEN